VRRTQIYLTEEQSARLDERARATGATRSTLIRRAIDEYLASHGNAGDEWRARWREAVRETAGIAPRLEEGKAYVERSRVVDLARLRQLER
jgi:predicted transcriptional regulator